MTKEPNKTTNQEKALAAFVAKKAKFDERLARLQALSDDHFDVGPDDVTWSHVDHVAHYANLLEQLTDMAFNEGEHAG